MKGEFPTLEELYDDDLLVLAREAARIEAEGYRKWTRTREVFELISRLGAKTIGLAYCPDMEPEVRTYARMMEEQGLRLVLPQPLSGGACGPLEQASLLNDANTDLNVLVGMCVGHDALFMRASQARVAALIARDTFLQHNTAAALYVSRGYFSNALNKAHRQLRSDEPSTLLRRAAQDPFGEAGKAVMDLASEISREGNGRWCRLEELLEFAARGGARKLGIVFCHGLHEEARALDRVLRVNDFAVVSVGCKAGAYPKEQIGLTDDEKVRPGTAEMICNPVAQAELLDREGVDIIVLLGQCVGHDTATIARAKALTVYLVVKDRVLAHNPAGAIYRDMAAGRA
jgi:uncharacterized metal-binding protein